MLELILPVSVCHINSHEPESKIPKMFEKFNKEKEKVKRKEELLERMEQKAIKLRNLDFYNMISETDEEMKKLLDEYKSL